MITESELLKLEQFFVTNISKDTLKLFQEEEASPNKRAVAVFFLFSAILESKPAETASNEECRAALAKIRFAASQIGFFSRLAEKVKQQEHNLEVEKQTAI